MKVKRMAVVYEYEAQGPNELSLRRGDVVEVIGEDDSGWWDGKIEATGETGIFPSNYTQEIEQETVEKVKNSSTRYRAYASFMMRGVGFASIFISIGSWIWTLNEDGKYSSKLYAFSSLYSLAFSTMAIFVELLYPGEGLAQHKLSIRGVIYLILILPLFSSISTIYQGTLFIFPIAVFFWASLIGELYSPKSGGSRSLADVFVSSCGENSKISKTHPNEAKSLRKKFEEWYTELIRSDRLGEFVFLFVFFSILIIISLFKFVKWTDIVKSTPEEFRLSKWAPVAKSFGEVLNVTCAIILLPVSRTVIRFLYEASDDHTRTSRILRKIFYFIPLDKSLEFHYIVGWTILVAAIGHTSAHFANLGLRPSQTKDFFNIWPFISGALISLMMMFMYSAVPRSVKNGHFEIFWYSHHCFIGFFILLLLHGRTGFGPNFWKFFLIPGIIYVFERIYRELSAYRSVAIVGITNMNDTVLIVEFDRNSAFPTGFKEGQYVFVNCPHVSTGQWHPFTISSPPQSSISTIHIRVQGKGSWTRQLLDYLLLMGPPGETQFKLTSQVENGSIPGKVTGPDGKQLLRIYGPLSAPTQHVTEYETDMIIGAGIGLTPMCSSLQSIVHYLWKFSSGNVFPSSAYFFWICNFNDLESFRWFFPIIKSCILTVKGYQERKEFANKHFELNIFITSIPNDVTPLALSEEYLNDTKFWGLTMDQRLSPSPSRTGTVSISELDLYNLALRPTKEGTSVQDGMVTFFKGRPDWPSIFSKVQQNHLGKKIGVAFCGNHAIGEDLKRECRNHSSIESKTFFHLHKENF